MGNLRGATKRERAEASRRSRRGRRKALVDLVQASGGMTLPGFRNLDYSRADLKAVIKDGRLRYVQRGDGWSTMVEAVPRPTLTPREVYDREYFVAQQVIGRFVSAEPFKTHHTIIYDDPTDDRWRERTGEQKAALSDWLERLTLEPRSSSDGLTVAEETRTEPLIVVINESARDRLLFPVYARGERLVVPDNIEKTLNISEDDLEQVAEVLRVHRTRLALEALTQKMTHLDFADRRDKK